MSRDFHKTVPVQVWVDADERIADMVRMLNTIPGVRTHASCQGTLGELNDDEKADGAVESPPYVMVSWGDDRKALEALETLDGWVLTFRGASFGYLHPTGTHWHTEWE